MTSIIKFAFDQAQFTDGDQDFIAAMMDRFPRTRRGFKLFAQTPPEDRMDLSLAVARKLLRAGYVRIGVPYACVQNVADHTEGCEAIADEISGDPKLKSMMAIHNNYTEPVIGDFTPVDKITPEEKHRLERLALRFTTLATPRRTEIIALWDEFEAGVTPRALLGKDIDRLEIGTMALFYEEIFPRLRAPLQPFWDSIGAKLNTDKGRALFARQLTARPSI